MKIGTVEGFISPTDFFAGGDPRYAILSGPGLFRDSAHAFATLIDPALNARILALGAVSKPWLDKLPEDLRRIMIEDGRAVHKEAQDWTHQFSAGLFGKWREAGGEVIDLPAADRAEMIQRIGPIVEEVARENAAVKELYDLVIATAKKAS